VSDRNQQMWPFGPAPVRVCGDGEHDWKLIDACQISEPPAPSWECSRCHWLWSRGWTKAEADKWLMRTAADREYYGILTFPDEPPYAEGGV